MIEEQFTGYDIFCAALVLLPIIIAGCVIGFCFTLLIQPVSADTLISFASQDGTLDVTHGNNTFSYYHSDTGWNVKNNPANYIETSANTGTVDWISIARGGISVNTTIPAGKVLTSAKVTVYGYWKTNSLGSLSSSMIKFTPASHTSYVYGDYDATDFTKLSSDVSYANFGTGPDMINYTVNDLTYINTTGYTGFMFAITNDVENNAPTWQPSKSITLDICSVSYSGGTYKPFITLEYEDTEPTPTPTPTTTATTATPTTTATTPPVTTTPITTLPPGVYCENQTGNITLNLNSRTTTSMTWVWNLTENITRIAEDGLFVLNFDNTSNTYQGTRYSPGTWHRLKIYNNTDFGQLNCITDTVVTTTQLPIMPSTELNTGGIFETFLSYWWFWFAGILVILILVRK